MDVSRRSVLTGLIAAPMVVRSGLLMPVRSFAPLVAPIMIYDGSQWVPSYRSRKDLMAQYGRNVLINFHMDGAFHQYRWRETPQHGDMTIIKGLGATESEGPYLVGLYRSSKEVFGF